ncbi:ABC transporter substrate-binding protein [Corynebacterium mendelii]|uniref:ABC transporter substrate-binding protein n=1 Tax=Corynebacterium mendelii TaxID=2765362 RepID=A0A939E1S8_9CORY|nr:ABC transporter substrate-binding protein [Corynebacterium mendelii]MBN9644116.1 ABC transporter substrate-binding protein [Corynebacterium mendelii]
MTSFTRRIGATVVAAATALSLAACSSSDPLDKPASTAPDKGSAAEAKTGDGDTIVIGTANFPESEIIGQIWKDSLEKAGFTVTVKSGIGSREVYLTALQDGDIDIIPEYSGNLAQYFIGATSSDPLPVGATAEQVATGLSQVLPDGLAIGELSPAESKDSYRVTREFSDQHGLVSLADLADLESVTIAANPEIADRPFGPTGLEQVYGVDRAKITIDPISDSGGPLTVAALVSGRADIANIYTTSPTLDTDGKQIDLVTLKDPENLILPQNVLPLMRGSRVPDAARSVLDDIDAALTTEDLLAMNTRHIGPEKADPDVIAADFVSKHS